MYMHPFLWVRVRPLYPISQINPAIPSNSIYPLLRTPSPEIYHIPTALPPFDKLGSSLFVLEAAQWMGVYADVIVVVHAFVQVCISRFFSG